ncbi:lactate/malate dehydrogenase family protein [Paraburkholderia sp. BL8N3]|nr:lactate/malate dehydrogenase family protein [Paraburkholderia sp. BL8N3]
MRQPKIVIVGAGPVGGSAARCAAVSIPGAKIVVADVARARAERRVLDLAHAAASRGRNRFYGKGATHYGIASAIARTREVIVHGTNLRRLEHRSACGAGSRHRRLQGRFADGCRIARGESPVFRHLVPRSGAARDLAGLRGRATVRQACARATSGQREAGYRRQRCIPGVMTGRRISASSMETDSSHRGGSIRLTASLVYGSNTCH